MRLGADVDRLDRLADSLAAAGRQLERTRRDLTVAAREVDWHGPDSERFRQQWLGHLDPATRSSAAALAAAGAAARVQAAEQRRVADGATLSPIPAVVGGTATAVPVPPRRIRIVDVGIDASVGAVASVGAATRFRVEDLAGGRSRSVELDTATASAGWGHGTSVSVGDDKIVGSATATAEMGVLGGIEQSWVIPTADVDAFVVSRALGPEVGEGRSSIGSVVAAIPGAGLAAGVLGLGEEYRAVTYQRPQPERVGVVGGAAGAAAVEADGPMDLKLAAAVGTATVGSVSRDTADGSWWVRLEQSGSAAVALGGSGPGLDAAAVISLHLANDGRPLTLSTVTSSVDGNRIERSEGLIDLTRPEMVGAARRLMSTIGAVATVGPAAAAQVGPALDTVIVTGAALTAVRSDLYRVTDDRTYGFESPVASASISTQELRREG